MASGREDWETAKLGLKRDLKKFVNRKWSNFRTPPSSDPSTPAQEAEKQLEQDRKDQELLEWTQQLPAFQYRAIPDKGYIRLLEIVPAPDKEWIQVRVSNVSLEDSAQTYDALSYVWGDPNQPRRGISVNGCHFEVYESLYDILFSLRPGPDSAAAASKVVLWVDAICINQEDVAERNAQVPIMDSIYRNARRTVIWLGPETKKTQRIFEMLENLANDSKTAAPDPSFREQETLPLTLMQYHKAPRVKSSIVEQYGGEENIWRVLKATWWFRSWTLQEILLSTNITFFMGRYKVDWEDFCAAVDHGFRLRIWSTLEQGTFVNKDILPYFTIKDLQRRLGLYSSTDRSSEAEHGPEILLTLLEGCRQRESKDPRDKIYAVSGILKNIQRLSSPTDAVNQVKIDADYASPVVYVYRMMSQQLILTTKTLDVLGIFPAPPGGACPPGPPRRASPADAVTLVLRGHEVATVTEISRSIPRYDYTAVPFDADYDAREAKVRAEAAARGDEDPTEFAVSMMTMRDLKGEFKKIFTDEAQHWHVLIQWERFAARREPTNPLGTNNDGGSDGGNGPSSVYWKTLCAGTYADDDAGATEKLFAAWSRSLEVLRRNEKRFGSLGYGVHPLAYVLSSAWADAGFPEFALYCECAIERRLGWCGNGWLALLPEGRAGDRIVLAEGGRVPLVVRPDGDGYYTFVGEAYVHGIMDGEAFEQDRCRDIKIC
ncbi:hypothetical protein PG997_011854 [Apiospora hydei]|uniref:Heterokaryon incompatibility domain-containing protein n=1 Tax=Apiospora hydei TaxID=1337664 RepID=A0ABR1V2E5_9PEZI